MFAESSFRNPYIENQSLSVININCCAFLQCKEIGFNCVSWPLESFANIKCKQSKVYFVCNHHFARFNTLFSSINQMILSKPIAIKIPSSSFVVHKNIVNNIEQPKNANISIEKKKRGPKKGSKRTAVTIKELDKEIEKPVVEKVEKIKKVEKQIKTRKSHFSSKITAKTFKEEQQKKTYQTRGKILKEIEELEDFDRKFSFEILCEQACKIFDQEFAI